MFMHLYLMLDHDSVEINDVLADLPVEYVGEEEQEGEVEDPVPGSPLDLDRVLSGSRLNIESVIYHRQYVGWTLGEFLKRYPLRLLSDCVLWRGDQELTYDMFVSLVANCQTYRREHMSVINCWKGEPEYRVAEDHYEVIRFGRRLISRTPHPSGLYHCGIAKCSTGYDFVEFEFEREGNFRFFQCPHADLLALFDLSKCQQYKVTAQIEFWMAEVLDSNYLNMSYLDIVAFFCFVHVMVDTDLDDYSYLDTMKRSLHSDLKGGDRDRMEVVMAGIFNSQLKFLREVVRAYRRVVHSAARLDRDMATRLFPNVVWLDRLSEFPSLGAFFHDVLTYTGCLMESRVSWVLMMRGRVFRRMLRNPCNSFVLSVLIHFAPLCSSENFAETAFRLIEETVSPRTDAVSLSAYRSGGGGGVDGDGSGPLVVFPDIKDAYLRMCSEMKVADSKRIKTVL